jgi:hypothetical protein
LVSVVGDTGAPPVDVLVTKLAGCYELQVESLEFHRLSPGDYLLVLPYEVAAVAIFNGGHPIQIPPFNMVCRRWLCFKGATRAALPNLVNVEIGGVLAHVWELETVKHLLDKWC